MQIGLLSTLNNELLPHYLKKLQSRNFLKIHVILSNQSKKSVEKDKAIFFERTKGYFRNFQLYDLKNINTQYYFVSHHNSIDTLRLIKKKKLDFLLNTGVVSKINRKIIKSTKGIVNIHPGILPFYKGCNCAEWAILNNDAVGNTAHFMNENYDSGPIITKTKVDLKSCYSYENMRIRVYKDGIDLSLKTFEILKKKNFKKKLVSQNNKKSNFFRLMNKKNLKKVKKIIKNNFKKKYD